MTELFSTILKLGMAGSYAIVLVFIVRFFLRKAPKIFSYVLWAVVFFRLICPYSFHADFSIVPESITYPEHLEIKDSPTFVTEEVSDTSQLIETPALDVQDELIQNTVSSFTLMDAASILWILGVIGFWGYSITSLMILKHQLKTAHPIEKNIYQSELITTPFVLGVLKPRIYLPDQIQEDELNYILMHERIHIQRKDYLIKPLAFMIACLHWFNPLVWIAWFSMSQDMEMSCDEAVIRKMGFSIKKEYSASLLSMASQKTVFNASPLAFSDHNAKNRILNVLNYKKPTFCLIALIAVLLTFLSLGLTANKYKSAELQAALDNLDPYLRVKPEDVEVLSEITKKELTIYKLSQGNDAIGDTFFLIFRNGELQDVYFNLPAKCTFQFYSVDAAEQIASQYVKDVYQMDVTFHDSLHDGKLNFYGASSTEVGTVLHFTSKDVDQSVSVSVSSATGMVIASSTEQLFDKSWKTSTMMQHDYHQSLLIAKDYVIHAKYGQAINIYPAVIKDEQIQFEQHTIIDNQDPFQLNIEDEKIQFSALASIQGNSFYSNHLETRVHAEHSTKFDFAACWDRAMTHYFLNKDQDAVLQLRNSLISTSAAFLNKEEKINWTEQWVHQMNLIDEITAANTNPTYLESGGWAEYLTTKVYYPIQGEDELLWTSLSTLISENGQYRVNETMTVYSEKFWKTTACTSPEEITERFVQALKYKDLSAIYEMMPYQKSAVDDAKTFIQLEIKNPSLDFLETDGHAANAQVHFKTLTHFTDEMGTTSTRSESHTIHLHMTKTAAGWILKHVTQ